MSHSQPLATTDLYLQSLLDASPVGMLVFNHREEVILANPLAQRMLGLIPQRSSLGRCGDALRCANRLTTDKGCGHSAACPNCPLFRGLRSTIAGTATPADQEGETRLDREPGCAPLWLRYKVRPLVINGRQGAILTLDDITALRQSEQQYAMLFREMLNAFALHEILCDDQGRPVDYRFLAVNPAFERMTGLPAERVISRTVLDVFPGIASSLIETYGRVALNGEPVHFEYFSREIGKHFTISAFCPTPGQFACLFDDISERKRAREELAKSEAKYRSAYTLLRSLCDNVPDMIWAKDLDKRYLFANEALCRGLLNATNTEEPLGKSDLHFAERERASHPDNPQWHTFGELCRDSDATTMDAGAPMQFDEFGNTRGQFLFLDVHKAPFLDEHGAMIGTVGSARDVTALKAMEQELREREQRLDLAIRGADLGTWDLHIPSGAVVTNQRWAEMLGYTADEVEPSLEFWSMRVHPDDYGRTQETLARHLAGETDRYESEHRLRHRSGEWIWVLDKGRVIERDDQGRPLRACGTHLDITRQKILIEQSRDGIVILDHQGKVREANQRFADMLGYSSEEVQHLYVWDWDTQWTREELLQAIEQIDATGDFFETCHRRKDDTIFPVEISTNGSICGGEKLVFCICRDISERKQMEEALRTTLRRTQIILSNIQPGILLVSDQNRIEFVNQSFCDLFKLEEAPADLLGITAADCIAKISNTYADPPSEITRIKEILSKNQPVKNEPIAISGNRTFLRDYFPINIQGKQYGRLWHHYDISDRKRIEEALARRDALLRAILRNIPLDFWVRDPSQRIIMQSDQSVRFWGDLVRNPQADWQFDQQTVERWQKNNRRALAGNLVVEDCPFISSTGEQFEWHKIVAPVRDGENILGIMGINIDITERKRAEECVRQRELFLRTVIETTADGFWVIDTTGKVTEVNEAYCAMSGFSKEELIGRHLNEIDAVEAAEQTRERIGRIMTIGRELFETRHRRKDGTLFPVEVSVTFLPEQNGQFVCFCRDLSGRQQVEKSLTESERNYRQLIETAADAIYLIAADGTIIRTNSAAARMLGYTASEMANMTIDRIDPNFDLEAFLGYWQAIAEDTPQLFESTHLRKDGSLVPVEVCGAKFRDGDTIHYYGIARDMTERKRMEEERSRLQAQLIHAQKMEAIGTLAGGIAHDFNNILGAVIGYAEMAREDSPPGSALSQDLDRVLEASKRAASLVKQILAFSRQQNSERVPLDPGFIVKEVVKLLRPSLPSTIAISQHINSSRTVLADPTQLHQVLMNLATNAFHAMEQTGGSLEIAIDDIDCSEADLALHPGIAPGPFVQLSIADTGPGIPPEIRDRIFDPYFTTKEVGKGTGMGLAIVDGIVRGSGGFITCASDPGKGAVFTITLPSCDDKRTSPDDVAESVATGSGHILLVDDEKILIEMGQSMLERLGYEVTVCSGSLEALTTFQNDPHRFDVVITDQTMPGMTGLDLARRLLQIRPGLPIILCTGYSNLVNEAKAKAYGIKGFAMKPLNKKEIASLIISVLDEQ